MPVAYIVCGRSYAGKTTLARLLAERLAIRRLSFDDPLVEEDLDPHAMSQDDWDRVYSLTYERFRAVLAAGESVVLDGANKRRDRNAARAIASECGATTTLLYLDAPAAEAWRRWHENARMRSRAQLAKETMERSLALFEEPDADEAAIVVPSERIEEWLALPEWRV